MRYKNYKDEILESGFGIIVEGENAGKHSYVEIPEIKEVEIDGKFVSNEGYDLARAKDNDIKAIEWQLVEQGKNKEQAKGMSIEADIDKKIKELKNKKLIIEGF